MGIIDQGKELLDLLQKIDNLDLYRRMLDLQREVMALDQQLRDQMRENERLREAFVLKGKLKFAHDAYYLLEGDQAVDGPFCTKCWDVDQCTVRIIQAADMRYMCPKCQIKLPPRLPSPAQLNNPPA